MRDERLEQDDAYLREFEATVVACQDGFCRLSRTAFFPGGGGQPCDRGALHAGGVAHPVTEVREDEEGHVWHGPGLTLPVGQAVRGAIDWDYRYALMRHHGLMHLVNAVALRRFDGVITGVQLGPEGSRIDLRVAGLPRERIPELEAEVNALIARGLAITATRVPVAEYERRPELVRTLNVRPPVVDGLVRVVEVAGYDAQACGGTHVHSTAEIGPAKVVRFDNKGKDNKRFYWALG